MKDVRMNETTIPAAILQSSPTMKSTQNSPKAMIPLTVLLRSGFDTEAASLLTLAPTATRGLACITLRTSTKMNEKIATPATRPSTAQLSPGHFASFPAEPSAPQKIPNAVKRIPTPNFMVFSGTLASGARSAKPAAVTIATAAKAAIDASPTRC